ncbi:MAG: AAA family ATPase, partial [Lachnospiraceae bacterium]|nr:AAA family ATPase [Lachnospiraceae bacterium]
HLGNYQIKRLNLIYIDSILSSKIIDGSYFPVNEKLVEDISVNPVNYRPLFENMANLKILHYLEACNRMDATPYYTNFALIHQLDQDRFQENNDALIGGGIFGCGEYQYGFGPLMDVDDGGISLSERLFREIVEHFRREGNGRVSKSGRLSIQQLALNLLSIYTEKGLYALAYRKLFLDVKARRLKLDEETTICTEYMIEGKRESARRFLDAEEYELLSNFEKNQEKIKDALTEHREKVDDLPYLIGLGADIPLDLHSEYGSIMEMFQKGEATIPLKAFFGDLLDRPRRTKAWPIALCDKKVNLDQLLAIDNAMKYPLAYIQGPPGTGKTSTIINTIITAFFNERTVLFSSYNNHPIEGVFEKLSQMEYQGKTIPFPVLRLGSNERVLEAMDYILAVFEQVKGIKVFEGALDKRKNDRKEKAKKLSALLRNYDTMLDLEDRQEALKRLLDYQESTRKGSTAGLAMMPFTFDLQGRQLGQIQKKIGQLGTIEEGDALKLLDGDQEEFLQYLYYTGARYIKRLSESRYDELRDILYTEEEKERVSRFNEYVSEEKNLTNLMRVFPVILTTCISAHRLGKPKPVFDMVIMDEASQCNTAVSLVPVIRGENLMLVGDPQQLNPVILLDAAVNEKLRKKYHVSDEYDYIKNSIYKTFLACDSVSDEVLLRNHYRCNKKIIDFNNQKYYHSKLAIKSDSSEKRPLVFLDVPEEGSALKNTAPAEARAVISHAKAHPEKSIGVITPFVNQRRLLEEMIKREGLKNVSCGTVHAFQGDEKDEILFSMAITERTA